MTLRYLVQVVQANTMAELRGWSRFVGLQVQYSLVERAVERDLLPMARAFELGVTSWGALGSGILTGKYKRDGSGEGRAARWGQIEEKKLDIAGEVVSIAEELGRKPAQVALNWVRQQPGVMLPMIGARTAAQLEENLGCLEFNLTGEQMQRLDEVSKIELGFPHDFLASDQVRDLVYSGTYSNIDNHRQA